MILICQDFRVMRCIWKILSSSSISLQTYGCMYADSLPLILYTLAAMHKTACITLSLTFTNPKSLQLPLFLKSYSWLWEQSQEHFHHCMSFFKRKPYFHDSRHIWDEIIQSSHQHSKKKNLPPSVLIFD